MNYKEMVEIVKEWEDTAKKQEFAYPLWFRNKKWDYVVEFEALRYGRVVKEGKNPHITKLFTTYGWTPHTDTDNWEQVENPNEHLDRLDGIVDEAIKEVSKEDSHNAHYRAQKIDTITRCKANMTLEQQKVICIFNCDKYLHRSKGQDLEDIQKVRYYLNWLEDIEKELIK